MVISRHVNFLCISASNSSHNSLKIKPPLKFCIDQKIKILIRKPPLGKEKDKPYPRVMLEGYNENLSDTQEWLRDHCSRDNAEVHCELIFLFIFMSLS